MIVCCGEALIDFLPAAAANGREAYGPMPGGSPFNTALALGRLGARVGFMGGLSRDFFGAEIARTLAASGVDPSYVAVSDRPTMLAFVALGGPEPQYAFYDEGSAARLFDPAESGPLGPEVACLHAGSISLAGEPAGSNIERLFVAEADRRVLSIDPNIRPSRVGDEAAYRARLDRMIRVADIVKISLADLAWLAPGAAPEAWAHARLADGSALVMVTAGRDGATAFARDAVLHRPVEPVAVVDTVGAGDTFTAGMLAALQSAGLLTKTGLAGLTEADLSRTLDQAARAAAITCTRAGADPPWASELAERLNGP